MKALTREAVPAATTFDGAHLWSCDWVERKLTVVRARYRKTRRSVRVRRSSWDDRARLLTLATLTMFTLQPAIRQKDNRKRQC